MATVPTVSGRTVAPRPITSPLQRAPSDAGGQALAQGFIKAGDSLRRADAQISAITLSEADAAFIERSNKRLYLDDDAYFKRQGKDAVDGLGGATAELDEIRDQVAEEFLTSATENQIFAANANKRSQLAKVKMGAHSFDERQKWDRSVSVANVQQQLESAANDPSESNLELVAVRLAEEVKNIAKIDGAPPETQQQNIEEALSKMYTAAVESALTSNPNYGRSLFESYKDVILHDDEQKLRDQIDKITIASDSRDLAREAAQESDNLEEQLKFIERKFGSNPNPNQTEIIERASQKATTARNQIETAQGIARSENYNFLGERVIAATKDGARGVAIIEALEQAFPDRFAGDVLSTAQRASLLGLAGVGQPNTTTGEGMMTYLKIMELAATNPSVLAQLDPADYLSSMGSTEFNKVEKAINEAKGAGITTETAALATRQKTLNGISIKHGFDLSENELSDAGMRIQRESIERLDEFVAVQKRQPTEAEWVKIIDTMFIKVLLDEPEKTTVFQSPFVIGQLISRANSRPDGEFAFNIQLADMTAVQREVVASDFRSNNGGRNPLPNELETHFVALMNDPGARQILLGN